MLSVDQQSFIKVTEVWVPNQSGTRLELQSGIYGELKQFQAASDRESFAYDEGLPGKVWSTRRPVILKELTPQNFKRSAIAAESGLTCGIAFPVFIGEFLKGVVVFLCGEDGEHLGSIEVWGLKTPDDFNIGLVDGYFGTMSDFAFITQSTKYTKGHGLPGLVWQKNFPVIIDDMGATGPFSRSLDLGAAQITTALGIPCHGDWGNACVVCLLSSAKMPIALRYEIWVPTEDRLTLALNAASCSLSETHESRMSGVLLGRRDAGILPLTWRTGVPKISSDLLADGSVASESAYSEGLRHAVTVPVIENGMLKSIVAWYF
ncbi:MAG: GAF domain-containing protein [Verrucomicrobiota bacterium]